MKKKPDLSIVFGLGGKSKPDEGEDEHDDGYSEDVMQACREFFEAAGIEPKDEKAACEALVALVDLRMGESEDEEGHEEETEGEDEEREAG